MADIYLRDLSGDYREEIIREIRKDRPDLAKVLDHNESDEAEYEQDIIVGETYKPADYKATNYGG